MKLSTSSNLYFNRPNNQKADVVDSINYIADAGFEYIDLSFLDYTNFKTDFTTDKWEFWLDSVISTAENKNVKFNQGHAPVYNFCQSNTNEIEWNELMIERALIAANRLNMKWLVFHASTDFSSPLLIKESLQKNKEYFLRLNEKAIKYNVGIAIENLWDLNIAPQKRFTSTVEELMLLIEEINDDNVGVCWDFEHGSIMQQNQNDALKLIGNKLKATHISDHLGITADHILPFLGDTNWQEVMPTLGRINYQGDISFEVHRFTQNVPDELIPATLQFSRIVGDYLLSIAN